MHLTPPLLSPLFRAGRRQGNTRLVPGEVQDRFHAKIRAYIDGWDDRCHPFVWTKTADQVPAKAKRPTLPTQATT
jgi:hypothetical protein